MVVSPEAIKDLEILDDREFHWAYGMSKESYREHSGVNTGAHHPQTEQALENATDSSNTRSNAKETPKPKTRLNRNSSGAQTIRGMSKPNGTPNSTPNNESTKQRKYRLNRNSSGHKRINGQPKPEEYEESKQKEKFLNNLTQQKKSQEINAAYEKRTAARDRKIERLGRRGSVGTLGLLGAVADGYFTYQGEREEDPSGSKAVDMAKAGAVAAGWVVAEPLMWAITLGQVGTAAGKALYEDANENYQKAKSQKLHITKDASGTNRGTLGGYMIDSEQAHTLRQRSDQVMRQHKIATESILGSEARQLHR